MQRFEITVDGHVQGHDYATRDDADAEATKLRTGNTRRVEVRASKTNDITVGRADTANVETAKVEPEVAGHEQGTPGNPPGAPQR